MDRGTLKELPHLLRPLATRIANMMARAVVQLADDGKKLQLLQVGALAGETVDAAEHHQPYGFSSVPLEGAESIVFFPNGDRSHPIIVVTSDRRYRPTGGQPGEVTVYNNAGASIKMTKDGDIIGKAAPGRTASFDDGSGAVALALLADVQALRTTFNTHTHGGVQAGGSVTSAPSTPASAPAGTTVLKGK